MAESSWRRSRIARAWRRTLSVLGGWSLRIAIGWTIIVLGTFFVLCIWVSPFSEWSAGDQTQLFQTMIGLAGFGAGLVVLVSAVEQLKRMTGRPELKLYITSLETQRDGKDLALIQMMLAIENTGGALCRDWQVTLAGTGNWMHGGVSDEWNQFPDGSLVYNVSDKPLFAGNPIPLPYVVMSISPKDDVGDAAFAWSGEIRYIIASEHAQDSNRIPITFAVEVPPHRSLVGGPTG